MIAGCGLACQVVFSALGGDRLVELEKGSGSRGAGDGSNTGKK